MKKGLGFLSDFKIMPIRNKVKKAFYILFGIYAVLLVASVIVIFAVYARSGENTTALIAITVIIGVLSLIAVAVLLKLFINITVKPFEAFSAKIKKIAYDLNFFIDIESDDEFVVLYETFLKITENLREHIQDVEELSDLNEKIEVNANFDMLTGIYNRRYFLELVEKHAALASACGMATFVIMLDLDHFKQVNDTYGHAAGDHVLKTIAVRVKETIRTRDLFGRFGGEEFVLFVALSDTVMAMAFAERIRMNIAASPVVYETVSIPVTTSIGVAQAAPGTDFKTALNGADKALYAAKESGRNRVEFYVK